VASFPRTKAILVQGQLPWRSPPKWKLPLTDSVQANLSTPESGMPTHSPDIPNKGSPPAPAAGPNPHLSYPANHSHSLVGQPMVSITKDVLNSLECPKFKADTTRISSTHRNVQVKRYHWE
jgi:hypothetical protein